MQIGNRVSEAENEFRKALNELYPGDCVVEFGTRRYQPNFPTHHAAWLPQGVDHLKIDAYDGEDVDVVLDIHESSLALAPIQGVIAVAVFEHLQRPWIAAQEIANMLSPDGIVYVETHHTFPQHGYPADYWRFSEESLSLIFEDAGLDVIRTGYHYPVKIIVPSDIERWNAAAPAWLNVDLFAVKP